MVIMICLNNTHRQSSNRHVVGWGRFF